MTKACVIGTGYVGLVTGACLSSLGHTVTCVDNNARKIETLKRGEIPIFEPGLKPLVTQGVRKKRLFFSAHIADGMRGAEVVFIAVNTPPLPDGGADLSYVEAVTREVAENLIKPIVIVEKSTVPVRTGQKIKETIRLYNGKPITFDVASNPEFLREGSAVQDFLHPDRVVIGVESPRAERILRGLYKKIKAPLIVTDLTSAELIKHASNSFLATKISYINAVAQVCERIGADITKVALGMGLDKRIGESFLSAGIGFGGSCFPKDLVAFIKMAEEAGYSFDLLRNTQKINQEQRRVVIDKLRLSLWNLRGKSVGLLGLAFKPQTDDLRNAPALEIINMLKAEGCQIRAHDPVAMEKAVELIGGDFTAVKDPYEAARDADALVLVTEWPEYGTLKLPKLKKLMKTPVIVDGRNLFNPEEMRRAGFIYHSIGRPSIRPDGDGAFSLAHSKKPLTKTS
jgi:UDPglucose 6-dehydrogenase